MTSRRLFPCSGESWVGNHPPTIARIHDTCWHVQMLPLLHSVPQLAVFALMEIDSQVSF